MIAIVDYGVGNLFSVHKALLAAGAEAEITSDEAAIHQAEKIVLPGVGAFGDCMKELNRSGLIPVIKERISAGVPLLGICVGLQILFEDSEESPGVPGLGVIRGHVRKIEASGLKVPHMGWNALAEEKDTDLYDELPVGSYVYFVHSYHAVPENTEVVTAITNYGSKLTASVKQGKVEATQFHPEKSGRTGLQILRNFVNCKA